jgi:hypothetical protein
MTGVACPNIGPRQRRRRLAGGVLALAGAGIVLFALLAVDAPRAARLLVALPVWAGALGVYQARAKT